MSHTDFASFDYIAEIINLTLFWPVEQIRLIFLTDFKQQADVG